MRDGAMVEGLGVVLDSSTKGSNNKSSWNNKPHVIVVNKANMIKPSPSSPSPQPNHPNYFPHSWKSPSDHQVTAAAVGGSFLDQCFLCQQKLLPAKDIFMYKGDRAFCSKECRCRQIFIDDNYFPLAPMKQPPTTSSSSSSPSSPNRKRTKNGANGFKGDRAFCSKECRCRQIFIDDNYFPLAPMIQPPTSSSSSSSSSPSSPNRKRTKNRANGFKY